MVMQRLAFIPARGGSKRAPNKNLIMYRGQPLVAYAARQALDSGVFDRVLVNTDNDRIKAAVRDLPVEAMDRTPGLAGDRTLLIDVIRDFIGGEGLGDEVVFALLLATAPLRTAHDISQAFRLFVKSGGKTSVVSVAQDEDPIDLAWRLIDGKLCPVFPEGYRRRVSKKDRLGTYHFNDALVIDSVGRWLDPERNLFGDDPIPYVMPMERSLCIDYEYQIRYLRGLELISLSDD